MATRLHCRASGFTLLEVLVALVVLSIGLLGLSGLQSNSLRNNYNALQRSQATILTSDIIDRMRANRAGAVTGRYNIEYSDDDPDAFTCTPVTGGCNESQVAQMDLSEWRTYVKRLPAGQSKVSVDAAGVVEIEVCWGEARGEDPADCGEDDSNKLKLTTRTQI